MSAADQPFHIPGKPPEGSIPKPGAVLDPRFSRDVDQDRRSKALKREARLIGRSEYGAPASPSLGSTSPGISIGQWPAQAKRTSRRDFSGNGDHERPMSSAALNGTFTRRDAATVGARSPTATVETMAVPASHSQHPQPLLTFDVSTKPAPPSKNEMPAWAARLEEVLAEDTRRSTTAQGPVQAQLQHSSNPSRVPWSG